MRPISETAAAWVPEYFGLEYLRLYQFPEERTGPEVAFLTRELSARIPGTRVLDLACGQGRHAVPLAQAGFDVVGLDYQEPLLRVARDTAAAQGAAVTFRQGDMRSLPFDAEFDAVINMFTAFGYFDDAENAQVLAEVARALKPGGWFIFDVANRDFLLRRHVEPRTWRRLPDGALLLNEWIWDAGSGRYAYPQILIDDAGQHTFTHTVRLYTCQELTTLLAAVSLHVEAVHGDFTGGAYTLNSPRMILLAQKHNKTP